MKTSCWKGAGFKPARVSVEGLVAVRVEAALGLVLTVMVLTACQNPRTKAGKFGEAPAVGAPAGVTMNHVTITNKIDPGWLQAPAQAFTLGPGDKLDLEIVGDATSRTSTVVGPDGKIYFNLAPGIDVWGLTLSQVKARIEDELGKYVRDKPQVSLTLRAVESQRIWVLGRVHAPGIYAMAAPMTLLEAVSMAGGMMTLSSFQDQEAAGISEELADLSRSFVIRQGQILPVSLERLLKKGDLSQNIYLQPDDFIYFSPAIVREIFVLGAVTQPRPVPYREGLTVAAAVASAYGTLKGAYLQHVAVVRGSLQEPQIAVVDYKAIIRGEAQDMVLEPHDIVYVPFSPFRYLQRYAELIVSTFVSSAAINAGSAIVTKQPTGVGGVFIPVGSGIQIVPPVAPPPIR